MSRFLEGIELQGGIAEMVLSIAVAWATKLFSCCTSFHIMLCWVCLDPAC